jgi:hypothetical protein
MKDVSCSRTEMFRVGLMRIKRHLCLLFVGFETGKDITRMCNKREKSFGLEFGHNPGNSPQTME